MSNGLYESQIRPEVSYDPHTQQVSVHFVVDSGRRARFTTPLVSGDAKMPLAEIIERHALAPLGDRRVAHGHPGPRAQRAGRRPLQVRTAGAS